MQADTAASDEVPFYPMPRAAGCPFDPAPEAQALLHTTPISRVRIWDGSSPWLITRHDHARAILTDNRFSAVTTRPGYPAASQGQLTRRRTAPTFIAMDGDDHKRQRRMLIGEFTVRRMQQLRPAVADVTAALLDQMAQQSPPIDLVENFALPLPSIVISRLLGVPYSDHDFFQSRSRTLMGVHTTEKQAEQASNDLLDFLIDLVAARQAGPSDDLIGRLAQHVAGGELERKEAASMALLLLFAGHETTANMIALGALVLLERPELAAVMRHGDDSAVTAGVEELLRLLTVAHLGRRRVALEDVDFAGVRIHAGEGIIVASELANRDPEKFANPDECDFDRAANQHMAFGFGAHQCLGQSLARLELQVCYPALFQRFHGLRAAVPSDQLQFREEMVVYGLYELPVTW